MYYQMTSIFVCFFVFAYVLRKGSDVPRPSLQLLITDSYFMDSQYLLLTLIGMGRLDPNSPFFG